MIYKNIFKKMITMSIEVGKEEGVCGDLFLSKLVIISGTGPPNLSMNIDKWS